MHGVDEAVDHVAGGGHEQDARRVGSPRLRRAARAPPAGGSPGWRRPPAWEGVLDLVAQRLAEVRGSHPVEVHLAHEDAGVGQPQRDLLGAELPQPTPRAAPRRRPRGRSRRRSGRRPAGGPRWRTCGGGGALARGELGRADPRLSDVEPHDGACHAESSSVGVSGQAAEPGPRLADEPSMLREVSSALGRSDLRLRNTFRNYRSVAPGAGHALPHQYHDANPRRGNWMSLQIAPFLQAVVVNHGSDLHLKAGSPPIRISGSCAVAGRAAHPRRRLVRHPRDHAPDVLKHFEATNEADYALHVEGVGRFRVARSARAGPRAACCGSSARNPCRWGRWGLRHHPPARAGAAAWSSSPVPPGPARPPRWPRWSTPSTTTGRARAHDRGPDRGHPPRRLLASTSGAGHRHRGLVDRPARRDASGPRRDPDRRNARRRPSRPPCPPPRPATS